MKATLSQSSLFFFVIFITLMLAGCGQSGPLYLPDKQKTNKVQPKPNVEPAQNTKNPIKQQEG